MNELAELERRYAEAWREMNNAKQAAEALVAAAGEPGPILAALAVYNAAIDRAGGAKRALDDGYKARAIALAPPPHVAGTPDEEEAWIARLDADELDALRRQIAARAALDAIPPFDYDRLEDPSLTDAERMDLLDEALARTERVIPLLDELDQATEDYESASAALSRALSDDEDDEEDE